MNHRLLPILTLLALAACRPMPPMPRYPEPRNLLTFEGSSRAATPPSGNRRRAPGEPRPGGALRQPARRAARREVYDTRRTSLERRGKTTSPAGKLLLEGKEVGQMTLTAYAALCRDSLHPSGLHQISRCPVDTAWSRSTRTVSALRGADLAPLSGRGSRALPKVGRRPRRRSWTCCVYDTRCARKSAATMRTPYARGDRRHQPAYDNSQINARVRLAGRS